MSNLNPSTVPKRYPVLSVRRKADRAELARCVAAVAAAHHCEVSIAQENSGYPGPRAINVSIQAPGGVCVTVRLNGDSSIPDTHVLHWHLRTNDGTKLSQKTFGESTNKFHFRKATDVADGSEGLLSMLDLRLSQAADGSAYLQPTEEAATA